jgi:hypothetical protein
MIMRGRAALIGIVGLALGCGPGATPAPNNSETRTSSSTQTQKVASAAELAPPAEPEPPPPPPPPPGVIVTLTVVSAEIEGKMPNGAEWDAKEPSAVGGVPGPIARYLDQHPELFGQATYLGIPVDAPKLEDNAKKTPAADPMVIVEVGPKVFRSPVKPRQFHPVWDFAATFLYGEQDDGRAGVAKGSTLQLHVVDYDGPHLYDVVGSTLLEVDELLSKKVHEMGPFGSVKKLVVTVAETPLPEGDAAPSSTRLAVPGTAAWTDSGIDLIAGQRVVIDAADEVCSKGGSLDHCSGPEGQRKTSSYNVPGFDKLGHGALIGAIGDTRFPVRRQLSFVAPSSGRLLLGINDKDTRDNRGSYAVRVQVYPVP